MKFTVIFSDGFKHEFEATSYLEATIARIRDYGVWINELGRYYPPASILRVEWDPAAGPLR